MSDWPTDGLPPGWADLAREDAEALAPPDEAKRRVQQRIAVTLGLGAGFAAATAASSTAAAASIAAAGAGAAGAGVAGAGAAGAGAAGAGVAGTAGSAGATGGGAVAATGIAGTLLAKKALVIGVAAAVSVGGGTAAYLEVRSERARSQPAAVAPAPARAPVAPPVVAPPAPEPAPVESAPPETLGEERLMLDRARIDIAQGRLAQARSLLAGHAERFPEGQLVEEREALVIRLLVREGRESEARARAARFRQQHPRSIQLPGIADALRERR